MQKPYHQANKVVLVGSLSLIQLHTITDIQFDFSNSPPLDSTPLNQLEQYHSKHVHNNHHHCCFLQYFFPNHHHLVTLIIIIIITTIVIKFSAYFIVRSNDSNKKHWQEMFKNYWTNNTFLNLHTITALRWKQQWMPKTHIRTIQKQKEQMQKQSIFFILTRLLRSHLPYIINHHKCSGFFLQLSYRITAQVIAFL